MSYVPYVIEKTGRGERTYDIYSRLLEDRIIFLGTEVNDHVANSVMAQLLFLDKSGHTQDIKMYINSPGGSVTAGLAIYDTMQYVKPDVSTICFGIAMSMGSLLLCGGAAGKRLALPNARILIHQPSGGFQGQATDIEIHAREAIATRERVDRIYAKHTGKSEEQVHDDMDRDRFFSAEEAADYGLIDRIMESRDVVRTPTGFSS